MNCRKFKRLIPDYLYGEISEKDKQIFLGHASDCALCRKSMAEMEETVSFLRARPRLEFSRSELASLRAGVNEEIARPGAVREPRPRLNFLHSIFQHRVALPVAAVVIVALLVGVTFLLRPAAKQEIITDPEVNKLVAMNEVIDNELQSLAELYQEIDELKSLFPEQADADSEVKFLANNRIISV